MCNDNQHDHLAYLRAVDLFRWMLTDDPAVRFSAAQALQHPFITEYIPSAAAKSRVGLGKHVTKTLPKSEVKRLSTTLADKENINPNVV